ncbi:hypothetical protein PCANC_00551 [Puccinia coronata f. sp. avenae]|uniref:Uncharacterized protein n=1 Tax=Puccinia coronata f. sp. avenae TaxID=200324 RepID=A0A2N5W7W7_9BASI|nr:hypothetical protein PCANC_00551 [Puccinia coronata f. sp. avenae]
MWCERLEAEQIAWDTSSQFRLISRRLNALMDKKMMDSGCLITLYNQRKYVPRGKDLSSPFRRLKIFTYNGCNQELWDLFKNNCLAIESFFIEMVTSEDWIRLPDLHFQSIRFPRLTTFTFRTNAKNEWFQFKDVMQLLQNAPMLKYLTIFQLQGPDSQAAEQRKSQIHSIQLLPNP